MTKITLVEITCGFQKRNPNGKMWNQITSFSKPVFYCGRILAHLLISKHGHLFKVMSQNLSETEIPNLTWRLQNLRNLLHNLL